MVSSWQHLLWSFCIHCWLCVTMTLTTEDWTESSEATMCKGNNNASVRVSQHIYIGLIGQNARWHLWIEITQKKVVLNPYSENTCMCLRVYIKVSTDTVCESWTGVCEWPRNNGLNYWISTNHCTVWTLLYTLYRADRYQTAMHPLTGPY